MYEEFARCEALLGEGAMKKLYSARVAVFGTGGVGGWCAEALARSGVGRIDLYDGDAVSVTNINRQAAALHSTLGMPKAEVMAARLRDVCPAADVRAFVMFVDEGNIGRIDLSAYDVVVDAVDTVACKALIAERALAAGRPVFSCMGTGNKLGTSPFVAADISKTHTCPLARAYRSALRKRGISEGVTAIFSAEKPAGVLVDEGTSSRHIPASVMFAPAEAGIALAREVLLFVVSEGRR